eukprot:gene8528-biopygen6825
MVTFKQQILESAGDLQLCAGQRSGCEAVVHALKFVFEEDDCDGILLVDADNAFNRINCRVMIHNIKIKLVSAGPRIGYFPKPTKSGLIVKPDKYDLAKSVFKDTNSNVTMEGKRHLGAVIGSFEFKNTYLSDLVDSWVKQILILSDIAKFYPQSAYCAFTAGFRHKFNSVIRTINNIEHLLEPVENAIRIKLITSLCEGRSGNDLERDLLSLPVKMGGLGIIIVTKISSIEYETSKHYTESLVNKIANQNDTEKVMINHQP